MARMPRNEAFSPDEGAMVHVVIRVVRRCFLLGDDRVTGKNYDHRKDWIEGLFRHFAACFGIDLLDYSIHVAGRPPTIDAYRSPGGARRFHVRGEARQLLSSAA